MHAPRLPLSRGADAKRLRGEPPPQRIKKAPPCRGAGSRRLTERSSQICSNLSVSASPSHLPWEGEAFICARTKGFPYEGKLSAARLTDEVGAAA